MRKKISIFVGIGIGLILIGFAWYTPNSSSVLNLRFLGFTNDASGARVARVSITNTGHFTIRRWGHFDREVQNRPTLTYTRTLGSHVLLSPGQAELVLVPLDAEPAASYHRNWRTVFYWRRENWQTRSLLWIHSSTWMPDWCPWLSDWFQRRGIRVQRAPTEWIDP